MVRQLVYTVNRQFREKRRRKQAIRQFARSFHLFAVLEHLQIPVRERQTVVLVFTVCQLAKIPEKDRGRTLELFANGRRGFGQSEHESVRVAAHQSLGRNVSSRRFEWIQRHPQEVPQSERSVENRVRQRGAAPRKVSGRVGRSERVPALVCHPLHTSGQNSAHGAGLCTQKSGPKVH